MVSISSFSTPFFAHGNHLASPQRPRIFKHRGIRGDSENGRHVSLAGSGTGGLRGLGLRRPGVAAHTGAGLPCGRGRATTAVAAVQNEAETTAAPDHPRLIWGALLPGPLLSDFARPRCARVPAGLNSWGRFLTAQFRAHRDVGLYQSRDGAIRLCPQRGIHKVALCQLGYRGHDIQVDLRQGPSGRHCFQCNRRRGLDLFGAVPRFSQFLGQRHRKAPGMSGRNQLWRIRAPPLPGAAEGVRGSLQKGTRGGDNTAAAVGRAPPDH